MTGQTSDSSQLVCPYCGHRHAYSWEYFSDPTVEMAVVGCAGCDRPFRATRQISVLYVAESFEPAAPKEMAPRVCSVCGKEGSAYRCVVCQGIFCQPHGCDQAASHWCERI